MSKLILARRALLFAAPALVAAASLMKVRSVDRLFFKEYDEITNAGLFFVPGHEFHGINRIGQEGVMTWPTDTVISKAEYEWNKKRLLKGAHINLGELKGGMYEHIAGGKFITGA